ncbi:MAG TPA: hypothetical protein VK679_01095 [Gemmatimonadaceae bacterium]|jgi:hypothetical protein|nr:hypothetical protein [Gemmatimonadaceae bacterium]
MSKGKKPLTANDVRALAETFDGMRDVDAYLVLDPSSKTGLGIVQQPPGSPAPPNYVLMCHTPNANPKRMHPSAVTITIPQKGTQEVSRPHQKSPAFDSLFWSESSWEKFLRPYYVRFQDQPQFDKMWHDINREMVVALAHDAKSEYTMLTAGKAPTPAILYRDLTGELQVAADYGEFSDYLTTLAKSQIGGPAQ